MSVQRERNQKLEIARAAMEDKHDELVGHGLAKPKPRTTKWGYTLKPIEDADARAKWDAMNRGRSKMLGPPHKGPAKFLAPPCDKDDRRRCKASTAYCYA